MPEPSEGAARVDTGAAGRPSPSCPADDEPMRFVGGEQIHDVWAERFVCPVCERESYRSYGRGSV